MTLDLSFWAETRGDAEAQALSWAAAEPKIAKATVVDAKPGAIHPTRWTVTVECTFIDAEREPTALELGL